MTALALLFAIVYTLNVVPAFAPPTWMVLSLVGLNYPTANALLLAITGACAATLGRITLAKLATVIVRRRFLSESARLNIDVIKNSLEHRRMAAASTFFLYALSPLPSNYLFIAYGLTALDLRLIAAPFFVGRFASYNFLIFSASTARRHLVLESTEVWSYFSVYFVASQILLLAIVYAFTRIDWRALLVERKFRWIRGDRSIAATSR